MLAWIFRSLVALLCPRVTSTTKTALYGSLHAGAAAGLPVAEDLAAQRHLPSFWLRRALRKITRRLARGDGLGEAMRAHRYVFDPIEADLAEFGERAGRLEEVFGTLRDHYQWADEHRSDLGERVARPLGSLLFIQTVLPAVIFIVPEAHVGGLFDYLMTSEVPVLAPIRAVAEHVEALGVPSLEALGSSFADLPPRWRLYLALGPLPLAVAFLACLALAAGAGHARRLPGVRLAVDLARSLIPLWHHVERRLALAEFSRGMALAQRSGIELLGSLTLARSAVQNRWLGARIDRGVTAYLLEGRLDAPLRGPFPAPVPHKLRTAVRTGEMDVYLDDVSGWLTREARRDARRLSHLVLPLTYGVVAFPVFAMLVVLTGGLLNTVNQVLRALGG